MPSPVGEIIAAAAVRGVLERIGLRWYLFGAQAALIYGAARLTADVDITVELGSHASAELVRELEASGFALRIEDDIESFVARTRVLPFLHVRSAMALDVVLAGPGLEELFLERAELRDIEGTMVPVASAEDLVAMKILAGRPKDLGDAAAISASQKKLRPRTLTRDTSTRRTGARSERSAARARRPGRGPQSPSTVRSDGDWHGCCHEPAAPLTQSGKISEPFFGSTLPKNRMVPGAPTLTQCSPSTAGLVE